MPEPEQGRLGRKWWKEGKLPNGKLRESKQVGEKVVERGKTPQPEAKRKQADWGESGGMRENSPTGS